MALLAVDSELELVLSAVVGSPSSLSRVLRIWCPLPRVVRSSRGGLPLKNDEYHFLDQMFDSFLQH